MHCYIYDEDFARIFFFDGLEILTSPCLDGARNVTMDFSVQKKRG